MARTRHRRDTDDLPELLGLDRLIAFADAVVAIAATLLVLPLVEFAPDAEAGHMGHFLHAHADQLLAFVLSFVVILQFWWVHHEIWRDAKSFSGRLVFWNLVWLFGVVVLPFPTQIVAGNGIHDAATNALYIGTMVLIGAAGLAQQWLLLRSPQLLERTARHRGIAPSVISTSALVVALVVSVAAPSIGVWALLALLVTGPVERAWANRRAGAARA